MMRQHPVHDADVVAREARLMPNSVFDHLQRVVPQVQPGHTKSPFTTSAQLIQCMLFRGTRVRIAIAACSSVTR